MKKAPHRVEIECMEVWGRPKAGEGRERLCSDTGTTISHGTIQLRLVPAPYNGSPFPMFLLTFFFHSKLFFKAELCHDKFILLLPPDFQMLPFRIYFFSPLSTS